MSGSASDVTVVMATRDRRELALDSVARAVALPERPPVVVVDDGSTDGTAGAVRERHPGVEVVRLDRSRGAAARNVGLQSATTPYVAFADDDSSWAPGALRRAAAALDAHPDVAVVAARILVGDAERLDPTCEAMAASPLGSDGLPGPAVLGFVACGAVVRRDAVLDAGGFPDGYGVGGEEAALACALASAGWRLAYVDEVVAHHRPAGEDRDPGARRRRVVRNDLVTAWRYRRGRGLARRTATLAGRALTDRHGRRGIVDALRAAPAVARQRRAVPMPVERQLRLLDAHAG